MTRLHAVSILDRVGPRVRVITVFGLGLLVAVSTAIQVLQTGQAGSVWRPYVLIGALLAGAIAAWQLVAGILLSRDQAHRDPQPEARAGQPAGPVDRMRRPWLLALTASLALIIAVTSVSLQFRPKSGEASPHDLANGTPSANVGGSSTGASTPASPPASSGSPKSIPQAVPPTMVWKGAGTGTLYWSTLDGANWSAKHAFQDRRTNAGAALTVANGLVYMAWREPGDSHIFWSTFNGSSWTAPKVLSDRRTDTVPALAANGSRVVMAWKGVDGDTNLYWSVYDRGGWSTQDAIPGRNTSLSPSLASVSGRVYMTWLEAGDYIYWSALNTSTWSAKQPILDRWTSTGAMLGCTPVGNLMIAWKGGGDDTVIWWANFDGSAWSGQAAFQPLRHTSSMPAMNCGKNPLTMVWRDADTNRITWARQDTNNWSNPQPLADRETDATPAVA